MYYLGIDSGGTKAAFLLGDEHGRIYARHRADGCRVLDTGKAGVKKMVSEGVAEICKKAGITPDDIASLGLGISGYGEGEGTEQETLEACEEVLSPGRAVCQCDTYIGWAGSLLFEPGINVISGTGSIVYGVNKDGISARCGGWGAWNAGCDEGSCTWHGQRVIQEWTRQADGRRPRTKLYEMFRNHFQIEGEDEYFVMRLNQEVIRGRGLPELQRFLAEVYEAGDPVAAQIYDEGAENLWQCIQTAAGKLGLNGTSYPVSYSGGLFKSGECALAPLRKRIESAGAQLVPPRFEPDVGALMMAIRFKHPDFDPKTFKIKE